MEIPKITDLVGSGKKVRFSRFTNSGREGTEPTLWYKAEGGFEFPVPVADTLGAEFRDEESAGMLMKWIRKHIKKVAEDLDAERQKHEDSLRYQAKP